MTAKAQQTSSTVHRAHSSKWLAAWRVLRLLGVVLRFFPPYYFRMLFLKGEDERTQLLYQGNHECLGAMGKAAGITVSTKGKLPDHGAFIAPNHVTYADIFALSQVLRTWYVAKAEVLGWPIVGTAFRFSRNLTVDRKNIRCLQGTNANIVRRINANYNVCVFLEGTSSDGDAILPFRGPLLQAALDGQADIIPVHLEWSASDPKIVIGDDVAYWRDHVMLPHARRLLGFRGLHVTIRFGEAICPTGDRKELAKKVRDAVLALKNDAKSQKETSLV